MNTAITAVKVMEDDEAFNAGRGAKLTLLGQVEMDAAVMQGDSMNAGTNMSGILIFPDILIFICLIKHQRPA